MTKEYWLEGLARQVTSGKKSFEDALEYVGDFVQRGMVSQEIQKSESKNIYNKTAESEPTEYLLALSLLNKAWQANLRQEYEVACSSFRIATIARGLSRLALAVECLDECLVYFEAHEKTWQLIFALQELVAIHLETDKPYDAVKYSQRAFCVLEEQAKIRSNGWKKNEAPMLGNVGQILLLCGVNLLNRALAEDAIQPLRNSLAVFSWLCYEPAQSEVLGILGTAYYRCGRSQKAVECYLESLAMGEKCSLSYNKAPLLVNLGIASLSLGQVKIAFEYSQKALEIAENLGDDQHRIMAWGNLGDIFLHKSEISQALEYYGKAEKLAFAIGNLALRANYLQKMGSAYRDASDWEQSLKSYGKALEIAEQMEDIVQIGNCKGNMGNVYRDICRWEDALSLYREAFAIAEKTQDLRNQGNWLGNSAVIRQQQGEETEALELYERAIQIARDAQDPLSESNWHGNMGNVYRDIGSLQKAIQKYEQALAIVEKTGERRKEGMFLVNIGSAYLHLGYVALAFEYYRRAFAIAQKSEDKVSQQSVLGNMGNAYYRENKLEDAIECYKNAEKIADEIGMKQHRICWLGNLGNAYRSQNKIEQAAQMYRQSLEISRQIRDQRGEASQICNLAHIYRLQGNRGLALQMYQQARNIHQSIGNKDGERITLVSLGIFHYEGDQFLLAHEYFQQSLELLEGLRDISALGPLPEIFMESEMDMYQAMVECCLRLYKDMEAWHWSEKARTHFLTTGIAARNIEPSPNVPKELREKYKGVRQAKFEAQARKQLYMTGQSTENPQNLDFWESQWKEVIRSIQPYAPEFSNVFFPQDTSLTEFQAMIQEDSLWIEFFVSPASMIIFMISHSEFQVLKIPEFTEAVLTEIATKWDRLYQKTKIHQDYRSLRAFFTQEKKNTFVEKYLREMIAQYQQYRTLWEQCNSLKDKIKAEAIPNVKMAYKEEFKQISSRLRSLQNWLDKIQLQHEHWENLEKFLHSGELLSSTLVLLEAYYRRCWEENITTTLQKLSAFLYPFLNRLSSDTWKNIQKIILVPHQNLQMLPLHLLTFQGTLVCDAYAVTYSPSAKAFLDIQKRNRIMQENPIGKMVGIATDPTAEIENSLYHEMEIAEKLFTDHGYDIEILRGKHAKTEDVLEKTREAMFIYFSCHALFAGDILQSGLLLHDGKLSLLQILLECSVEKAVLVILSACETGMAIPGKTSEYLSLASSFLYAGAGHVLGTLWSVNELSTSLLMGRFLREYLSTQNPSASLQKAQNWLRELQAFDVQKYLETILSPHLEPDKVKATSTHEQMLFGIAHILREKNNATLDENAQEKWKNFLAKLIQSPQSKIYEHPYYWAGFYVI